MSAPVCARRRGPSIFRTALLEPTLGTLALAVGLVVVVATGGRLGVARTTPALVAAVVTPARTQ